MNMHADDRGPGCASDAPPVDGTSRRHFLKKAAALPAALMAAQAAIPGAGDGGTGTLPQVPFGKYFLSRLVCGGNPFNGGSHQTNFVSREMRSYYTREQVLKTLRRCQEVGINFWQSSGVGSGGAGLELYRQFVAEGGRIHYLSLAKEADEIAALARGGCVGIAHHGEVTDTLFKAGKLDQVYEFTRRVRDAGMLAGISTHMPAVVEAVEAKGWEVDFFMTCVYQRNRSAEELQQLLGHVPLPVREVYLEDDPPKMFKVIRQTRRPCLAFKILAAGRLCESQQRVEQAFREAFAAIKPTDAVIVGIYDRYTDQPAENAGFTRRFGVAT
jgi:hypothetical protein